MKTAYLAYAALLISPGLFAATSIDIQVVDVLAPPACNVTLGNNGVVDYGNILVSRLNNAVNAYTLLDEKRINLNIQCESNTLVAIKGSSNRRGTLAGVAEGALNGSGFAPVQLFGLPEVAATGLGLSNGKKIGGFGMKLVQSHATANGVAVDQIYRYPSSPNSWSKNSWSGVILHPTNDRQTSWGTPSSNTPVAFSSLNAELGIQAYINKKSELDLSKPVTLDGSVTLELIYL